ncbi:MAG: gfo/Idh/MocA family oxidoreductase [Deltaproteobacteria bacterium]|nr:MAG: gfo/Idh/MocA family oxidoreductase [Deltaproteobacteria bacterium]
MPDPVTLDGPRDAGGGEERPLRVGIIGMGKVGRRRAAIVEAHPDLHLEAVCDTNLACRKLFPDRKFHEHFPDLIEEDLDIVFVCAYNKIAPQAVTMALDAGKHVFCEKPPGCCVEDVEAMIAAERRNPGRKLKFGFNHRYHYSVMEAKSLIDGGRFGKILWMRGIYGKCGGIQFENEWRNSAELSGGGILLDQGIHMLDLLRYFGGEFTEVQSVVTTSFWNIPVEDNAFAILRGGDVVAMLHSSATQWKHRFSLEICLQAGYIDLRGILSSTRSYGEETLTFARRQFEDETFAFGKPREETIFFDTDDSWSLEIEEFVSAIRNDTPIVSGNSHDALKVMMLIERIYREGGGRR